MSIAIRQGLALLLTLAAAGGVARAQSTLLGTPNPDPARIVPNAAGGFDVASVAGESNTPRVQWAIDNAAGGTVVLGGPVQLILSPVVVRNAVTLTGLRGPGGEHLTVVRGLFTHFRIRTAGRVVIRDLHFQEFAGTGLPIEILESNDVLVEDNRFLGFGELAIRAAGDGFIADPGVRLTGSLVIRDNECVTANATFGSARCIRVLNCDADLVIERNVLDAQHIGILIEDGPRRDALPPPTSEMWIVDNDIRVEAVDPVFTWLALPGPGVSATVLASKRAVIRGNRVERGEVNGGSPILVLAENNLLARGAEIAENHIIVPGAGFGFTGRPAEIAGDGARLRVIDNVVEGSGHIAVSLRGSLNVVSGLDTSSFDAAVADVEVIGSDNLVDGEGTALNEGERNCFRGSWSVEGPPSDCTGCLPADSAPVIASTAHVHADAVLLGGAVVEEAARVAAGAVVGDGSRVASRAVVGGGAALTACSVVGDRARIGGGARLGPLVTVDELAWVGDRAFLDTWVRVGEGAILGDGVVVQRDALVGEGARIAAGVFVGRGAVVGEGATVAEESVVPDGAVIAAGATFDEPTYFWDLCGGDFFIGQFLTGRARDGLVAIHDGPTVDGAVVLAVALVGDDGRFNATWFGVASFVSLTLLEPPRLREIARLEWVPYPPSSDCAQVAARP
jgi:carbonic anhydrase/acetyltransferase-like protein (isoleucine patch superfamily)